MEEFTHVCKLCNKTFPNGKSLNGHMGYHARSKAANFGKDGIEIDTEIDNVAKKRCKIVYDNEEEIVCKKCGKGFKSLKALYGHMTVHSDKNNNRLSVSQKANEVALSNAVAAVAVAASSSSRSEIEQYLELEEVAMCLMMLSRDCSTCFDFAVDVDNNVSDSPEAKANQNYSRKKQKQKQTVKKDSKCSFCGMVFKCGQALGGHMRKHTLGSKNVNVPSASASASASGSASASAFGSASASAFASASASVSASPPSEPVVNQLLFDLNLPAPEDEEDSGWFSV